MKEELSAQELTQEQVYDVYAEGTSDGINIQGKGESIKIPRSGHEQINEKER
ncbi:MAG: hypothetical protein H0Z34_02415 [Brevibacillus sp.]|nr:hypothetical protein [Brevibacillus sp.]